ncbi:DEAD/DEAH box helicase [Actinomycetospora rhizophila]|uniref:DEAD/DEAH box helicase n=1 Tax=Actinomycetospora rhizophila TaxID=1416876 RepID=A0ABV9ZPH7_9PSEU
MATTVYDVLDDLRRVATSEADKGSRFEQLIVSYLKTDPTFADQFSDVYMWQDWPGRNGRPDRGIDIVAVDRLTQNNVAIQCKFYDSKHHVSKRDIDTFMSASGTTEFNERMIVSTGADWGPNAEATLQQQAIPVRRIGIADLEASNVDWAQFSWATPDVMPTKGKKTLRPHQRTAVDKVRLGLEGAARGKLIMACGTGKTFTSLRLCEEAAGAGATVLFLVPSISLLSQTIREWATEAEIDLRMLAVCSDVKATKRSDALNEDISAVDLALPATTDRTKLRQRWARANEDDTAMTVVFSTYQSIEVVAETQQAAGFPPFDLIICDEAHRTTGITLPGSEDSSSFVKVHDDGYLKGAKRLYMTATPRLYRDDSKKKASDSEVLLASMDDEEIFGEELHRLGFGEAVEKDLLTDYRVLVLAVDQQYVSRNFQDEMAAGGEIPLSDAAKIVGCWNGLSKNFETTEDEASTPMRRAVAFARDIQASKSIAGSFSAIVDRHIDAQNGSGHAHEELKVRCEHVDGTFNALERNKRLDWLQAETEDNECRVLTNARCLSEGVDVPALDAVMFLTPRSSEVDVVQSVGRVMRKAPGKDFGYIILPIAVPAGVTPEVALQDNDRYNVVWQVLQALRAHDDRFNATVNQIDLNKKKPDKIRVVGVPEPGSGDGSDGGGDSQQAFEFDFGEFREAIYARIVRKVGERRYWESWAKDVAYIAQQHIERINGLLAEPESLAAQEFSSFLDGLRGNLNEGISAVDAVEMLAQHLITRPVFEALFADYRFAEHNPVAQTMESMLAVLDQNSLDTENGSLEGFYKSVRSRTEGIDNAEGRQRIIVELYEKFFSTAFKKTVDRLGIVYTPTEIVDFILRSADEALRSHFDTNLSAENVHILDGFTGTGTFVTRLLQLGVIESHDLARKYAGEIHANEILLLAYYIAAVNIESTYQDVRRRDAGFDDEAEMPYEPFPGLVLTDTFQSYEDGDRDDLAIFPENNERISRQRELPITVVVGNPPYSVGQSSANDDNANESYPTIDTAIRDSYAERASGTLLRNLYDSYVRAIKWASLRIGDRGVIAYVTNGSWVDANAFDGMRLSVAEEFSDIYVFNLRGNQRTAGEVSRREGGKIFGSGSRAPVAIAIFVRDPARPTPARVHDADVGEYLTREQKLANVRDAGSFAGLTSVADITPNSFGDWREQRTEEFASFIPVAGDNGIFPEYSLGISTNRDSWTVGSSRESVERCVQALVANFDQAITRGADASELSSSQVAWSRSLRARYERGRLLSSEEHPVRKGVYRPFFRQWTVSAGPLVEAAGRTPRMFDRENQVAICILRPNERTPFSVMAVDSPPNLGLFMDAPDVYPLYRVPAPARTIDQLDVEVEGESYNIAAATLSTFRAAYGADLSELDVFHYVYGLLHSRQYRETYFVDLKKSSAHVPLVKDPWPFMQAGKDLMELHVGYESVTPYPLAGLPATVPAGESGFDYCRLSEMAFGRKRSPSGKREADRGTIVFNERITLSDIPETAYSYQLGSRSAVEWLMDRYRVKTDKASGIVSDPNDWAREVGDPRYILDLVARVVTLSVETVRLMDELPAFELLPRVEDVRSK